uniref:AAA domain-containing protein n=1 Tax=Rhizophagus irregularis (strain DAOM 181602 / DAOM 197198 / MUCL 43194) TaxID=747089 RepID=U9UTS7_RHIID
MDLRRITSTLLLLSKPPTPVKETWMIRTTEKEKVRDLFCKSSLDAVSGISEPNTFFCVGHRTFAPSNRVHDDINYFIEPKEAVERLGNFLRDGKFCLLCGHRQSGKTTTAYAIEEWLLTNCDKDVYVMNLNNGIVINDGPEKFWWSICCQLESLDKNRFSFDKREEASSLTFVGFFSNPIIPMQRNAFL